MSQLSHNDEEFEQEIETIKAVYPDQVTVTNNPLTIICLNNNAKTNIIETTFRKSNDNNLIITVTNNAKAIEKYSKKFLQKLESKLNNICKKHLKESGSMPIYECILYLNDLSNKNQKATNPKQSASKNKTYCVEEKKNDSNNLIENKKKSKKANKSNNRFRYKHNEMVKNNENKTDADGYDYFFAYNYKHYVKDAVVTDKYVLFYKDVFSQWFPSEFVIDNVKYANCEQYMMAEKAKLFNDEESLKLILSQKDPNKIKKLGRRVSGFKEKMWIAHREEIVYKGNLAKFTQNEILKNKLLSYDKNVYFVEASGVDRIWGIGLAVTDPAARQKRNWKGLNLLGKAITKVRNDILE